MSDDELGMPVETAYTIKYDLCIQLIDMNVWDYECFVHATGVDIPFSVYFLSDTQMDLCVCCECKSPKSNDNTHRCCAVGA